MAGTGKYGSYFPVPFDVEDLPSAMQESVLAGIKSSMDADEARQLLSERLETRRDEPAVLLATAFLGLQDACEIMVDEQQEAAVNALALATEARSVGAEKTPDLERFEALAVDVRTEEAARRADLASCFQAAPRSLTLDQLSAVGYELIRLERHAEAATFFSELITREPPYSVEHYRGNLARCQEKGGQLEVALATYREVWAARTPKSNDFVVDNAGRGLLMHTKDRETFERIFEEGVAWGEEAGRAFPFAHGVQDDLLVRAQEFGSESVIVALVSMIVGRRPGSITEERKRELNALARSMKKAPEEEEPIVASPETTHTQPDVLVVTLAAISLIAIAIAIAFVVLG